MADVNPAKFPQPFEFTFPDPSLVRRATWLLTRTGRAYRKLWQAFSAPDDAVREQTLIVALDRLRRGRAAARIEARVAVRSILLYLVWSKIRKDALEESARWLAVLDAESPQLPERIALRWQLMAKLLAIGAAEAYVAQACALVADRMVTPKAHAALVIQTLRTVYARVSPSACESVTAAAHGLLGRTKVVRTVLGLCRCPKVFRSRQEAESWATRIDANLLEFSRPMVADAMLVSARAAEWADDWAAMTAHAQRAATLQPTSPAVKYWLARARVHQDGASSAQDLNLQAFPAGQEWARLRHLILLRQQPTLSHAEGALEVLSGQLGEPDLLERNLILAMLKQALMLRTLQEAAYTGRCANLCQALEKVAGRLPWAQLNIAAKEVQIERRYEAAIKRLEEPDVLREPMACTLLRVAHILRGSPLPPSETDRSSTLDAVERSVDRLLGGGSPHSPASDPRIWQKLDSARQDALVQWCPEMQTVCDVLSLALRATARDRRLAADVTAFRLPSGSPAWAAWLLARTYLLVCNLADLSKQLETIDVGSFPTAWSISSWRGNYGRADVPPPGLLAKADSTARERIGSLRKDISEVLAAILDSHSKPYANGSDVHHRTRSYVNREQIAAVFAEVGSLASQACAVEIQTEIYLMEAQMGLAQGNLDVALKVLEDIQGELVKTGTLVEASWSPVVRYFTAVALARVGKSGAEEILEDLVDGPKGPDARGQLAILAMAKGDLSSAAKWIEGVPVDTPGLVYARGLLYSRRGDPRHAQEWLQGKEVKAVVGHCPASPYGFAIRRLLAAIQERQGNLAEAEAIHRENLTADPTDPVTSARLLRLLVHKSFSPGTTGSAGVMSVDDCMLMTAAPVKWSNDFSLLSRLLAASGQDLDALYEELNPRLTTPSGVALRQVFVRRLLQEARAQDAWNLLQDSSMFQDPTYAARAYWVVRTWHEITNLWKPSQQPDRPEIEEQASTIWEQQSQPLGKDEGICRQAEAGLTGREDRGVLGRLMACAEGLERLAGGDNDAIFARWGSLVRLAVQTVQRPDGEAPNQPYEIVEGDDWLFWHLPAMWSTKPDCRRQAAEAMAARLVAAGLVPLQRALLKALACWYSGEHEHYLECYEDLREHLDTIPVDGRYVWLSAGRIWFLRKEWKNLLEGDLPECVADLSHQDVRLLIGLAYAQAAVDDSVRGDARAALQKVRQARSALETLAQADGPEQEGS